jgi:heat shock protein HtpX
MSIPNVTYATANWRETLRKNNRKTFMVISLFFLIYLALGLFIDVYIASGHYPQASLSQIFMALVTFKLFPMVTLITVTIAAISLLVTFSMNNKLMLLGTEYREIKPETAQTLEEKQLYNIIEELKIAAGLQFMPRVYIIDADYMHLPVVIVKNQPW